MEKSLFETYLEMAATAKTKKILASGRDKSLLTQFEKVVHSFYSDAYVYFKDDKIINVDLFQDKEYNELTRDLQEKITKEIKQELLSTFKNVIKKIDGNLYYFLITLK